MANHFLLDPSFWRSRIEAAGGDMERAMFRGSAEEFSALCSGDKDKVDAAVGPDDSVLDAGCGYGRLLTLMPDGWTGRYVGVDISPEFIQTALMRHPGRDFRVADLRRLPFSDGEFSVAVVVWVRSMIVGQVGRAVWNEMEKELRRVADRLVCIR